MMVRKKYKHNPDGIKKELLDLKIQVMLLKEDVKLNRRLIFLVLTAILAALAKLFIPI